MALLGKEVYKLIHVLKTTSEPIEVEWSLFDREDPDAYIPPEVLASTVALLARLSQSVPTRLSTVDWEDRQRAFSRASGLGQVLSSPRMRDLRIHSSVAAGRLEERKGGAFFVSYDHRDFEPRVEPPYGKPWEMWKDVVRSQISAKLGFWLERYRRGGADLMDTVFLDSLAAVRELLLNAIGWGRCLALVSAQRQHNGFVFSICDAGPGFLNTIREQDGDPHRPYLKHINDEATAISHALFARQEDDGLFTTINRVVSGGGHATVYSSSHCIRLNSSNWSDLSNESRSWWSRDRDGLLDLDIDGMNDTMGSSKISIRNKWVRSHIEIKGGILPGAHIVFFVPTRAVGTR